jgi:hypothetical protein
MDDDDGRQVMRIAHMTLWVRWAKKPWKWPYHSLYLQVKNFQFSLPIVPLV